MKLFIILTLSLLLFACNTQADENEEMIPVSYEGNIMGELGKILVYPQKAKDTGIEGQVLIQVKVDETGKAIEHNMIKSSGNEELDNEALRAIKELSKWIPAKKSGKPVSGFAHIPVKFEFNKKTKKKKKQD